MVRFPTRILVMTRSISSTSERCFRAPGARRKNPGVKEPLPRVPL